jgi:hypothetical protein
MTGDELRATLIPARAALTTYVATALEKPQPIDQPADPVLVAAQIALEAIAAALVPPAPLTASEAVLAFASWIVTLQPKLDADTLATVAQRFIDTQHLGTPRAGSDRLAVPPPAPAIEPEPAIEEPEPSVEPAPAIETVPNDKTGEP